MSLLAADPADSFARYALALEHKGMGELDRATELLEEVIQRDPLYVPAYQQLGSLYHQRNRKDGAISILKKGMEQAGLQGDSHAQKEMQEALDEILS